MKLFRVLLAFDIAIAAVTGLVFGIGLVDAVSERHVDREDLMLWPPLIVAIATVLVAGCWLKARGKVQAANGVLLLIAIPGLIAGCLVLYLITELLRPGAWR